MLMGYVYMLRNERDITMKDSFLYVFMGYGSAYVLEPIASYMKKKGYCVYEINPVTDDNYIELLKDIKDERIIFITSYHLYMDKYNYFRSGGIKDNDSIAPLEMMDMLKPVKTVFYPHDLDEFMLSEEMAWCDLFDVFMTPLVNNIYFYFKLKCEKVANVGWIKKTRLYNFSSEETLQLNKIVYLPSDLFEHLTKYGVDGLVNLWITYIDKSIPLKLPQSKEYDVLKLKLLEEGFTLIDENKTVFSLIEEFNIIIGYGFSTVIYEAALSGKSVISLIDDVCLLDKHIERFKIFKNVRVLTYQKLGCFLNDLKNGKDMIPMCDDKLKPFDFEQALRLIIYE